MERSCEGKEDRRCRGEGVKIRRRSNGKGKQMNQRDGIVKGNMAWEQNYDNCIAFFFFRLQHNNFCNKINKDNKWRKYEGVKTVIAFSSSFASTSSLHTRNSVNYVMFRTNKQIWKRLCHSAFADSFLVSIVFGLIIERSFQWNAIHSINW